MGRAEKRREICHCHWMGTFGGCLWVDHLKFGIWGSCFIVCQHRNYKWSFVCFCSAGRRCHRSCNGRCWGHQEDQCQTCEYALPCLVITKTSDSDSTLGDLYCVQAQVTPVWLVKFHTEIEHGTFTYPRLVTGDGCWDHTVFFLFFLFYLFDSANTVHISHQIPSLSQYTFGLWQHDMPNSLHLWWQFESKLLLRPDSSLL